MYIKGSFFFIVSLQTIGYRPVFIEVRELRGKSNYPIYYPQAIQKVLLWMNGWIMDESME